MTKYFEGIDDRRQQWKIKYLLVEVIVMTIIAVTAGADNWSEIAMYCKGKIRMFQEKFGLKLENGVPTIVIGNPLRLSPDFLPLYTVRESFPSYGVLSFNTIM